MADSSKSSYEFSYNSTPELAKQAARLFIWRRAGAWLIALCLMLMFLLILVSMGHRSWYAYVGLGIGFAKLYAWLAYYQKTSKPFRELTDPKVDVRIDEKGITMQLVDGGGNIAWQAPIKILKSNKIWLLTYFSERTYTVLPADAISPEAKEFIQQKVIENGGAVI